MEDLMATAERWKRILRRCLWSGLILFLVGCVAAWIVAGQLVAARNYSVGEPPPDFPAESVSLPSESGSVVAGWHARAKSSLGVVVLLHGIGGSRLSMLERARWLHAEGYSVVLIDLQAHGESPGTHITTGYLEKHDVKAAVEYARREHPGERIGVLGVSLGGASALLASPLDIDALVVESVFPDIRSAVHNRVAARLGPLAYVPAELLLVQMQPRFGIDPDELSPIACLPNVGCPVFVISGSDDLHTTASETQEMFRAAAEPRQLWLVDGAAHVDLLQTARNEYKTRVITFFDEYLTQAPAD